MSGDPPDDEVAGRTFQGEAAWGQRHRDSTESSGTPPRGWEYMYSNARTHLIKITVLLDVSPPKSMSSYF